MTQTWIEAAKELGADLNDGEWGEIETADPRDKEEAIFDRAAANQCPAFSSDDAEF